MPKPGRLVSKRDITIQIYECDDNRVLVAADFLDPYHLIRLTLVVDPATKTIERARAEMANHPHTLCPNVLSRADELEGIVIGRGVMREIARRVGGGAGCVHLRELAIEAVNFAATALIGYNEGYGIMSREFNLMDEDQRYDIARDMMNGTCFIFKGGDKPGEQ